jgi:hypothetical protein
MQYVPSNELNAWLFRGWTMDIIGKIHPPSSNGHN